MTAKETLDKLHKYLDYKEKAAWAFNTYSKETYGEDSDEARKARAIWSEIFHTIDLIEHPEKLDELLVIWEETND